MPLILKYYLRVLFSLPSIALSYVQYTVDKRRIKTLGLYPITIKEFRRLWGSSIILRYVAPIRQSKSVIKTELQKLAFIAIEAETLAIIKGVNNFTFHVVDDSIGLVSETGGATIDEFLKDKIIADALKIEAEKKYISEYLINLVMSWL